MPQNPLDHFDPDLFEKTNHQQPSALWRYRLYLIWGLLTILFLASWIYAEFDQIVIKNGPFWEPVFSILSYLVVLALLTTVLLFVLRISVILLMVLLKRRWNNEALLVWVERFAQFITIESIGIGLQLFFLYLIIRRYYVP